MKMFVTSGVGYAKEDKNAFDRASREGSFSRVNIINLSSIIPADTVLINDFFNYDKDGNKLTAIHGVTKSNVPGQIVTSAIAYIHIPGKTGFVCELFGTPGIRADYIKERVERMVLQLYCEQYSQPIPNYNSSINRYLVGNDEITINSIVAEGIAPMNGDYCSAIVAIFLVD